jgi:cytochrome oxidase Cu insertion factor (SCO1/SenC/PrrC family)
MADPICWDGVFLKRIFVFLLLAVSGVIPQKAWALEYSALPASQPIADERLVDQNGRELRFYSDLVRGQKVVINFMFTSCTMICPPISAVSAKLAQDFAAAKEGAKVISISIDPESDTVEKLQSHRARYLKNSGAENSWILLTGARSSVSRVLASLGQPAIGSQNHDPVYIVGDDRAGKWTMIRGIASPKSLESALKRTADATIKRANSHDANTFKQYFTDTEFTDQSGRKVRLYSDLLKGHKVLVNFGFTRCTAICSPATNNLATVQKLISSQMETQVRILTFTVDPDHDTPEVLKKFAEKHGAGRGWYFLTGNKAQISKALQKLGGWTEVPDNHSGVLMYGDVDKGVWSKSSSMDSPREIAFAISKISDNG